MDGLLLRWIHSDFPISLKFFRLQFSLVKFGKMNQMCVLWKLSSGQHDENWRDGNHFPGPTDRSHLIYQFDRKPLRQRFIHYHYLFIITYYYLFIYIICDYPSDLKKKTALKIVREKVVPVDAQTCTKETKITAL